MHTQKTHQHTPTHTHSAKNTHWVTYTLTYNTCGASKREANKLQHHKHTHTLIRVYIHKHTHTQTAHSRTYIYNKNKYKRQTEKAASVAAVKQFSQSIFLYERKIFHSEKYYMNIGSTISHYISLSLYYSLSISLLLFPTFLISLPVLCPEIWIMQVRIKWIMPSIWLKKKNTT